MNVLNNKNRNCSGKNINYQVIDDIDVFCHMKDEWDDLLTNSAATSFFLTFDYISTWWSVYGASYKLRIITARNDDGKLLGIAPMMIGAGERNGRWLLRQLVFIGGLGDTLSEDQDFIVLEGQEMAIVPSFLQIFMEKMAHEWDTLQLGMISSESPCLEPLSRAASSTAGELRCSHSHIAPFASLPVTWVAYLATRSKSCRTGFNRRARKLERDHSVEFLTAGRDIAPREAIKIVASLCRERWGSACLAFRSEKFFEFHSRLAELLAPQQRAHIVVMKVDGEVASAGYDLVYGAKVFQFQAGWKKSFARMAIGKVMLGKRIEWAINQGHTEYDMLAGDAGYKADWATGHREFLDFELINPKSLRGRTFGSFLQSLKRLRNVLLRG